MRTGREMDEFGSSNVLRQGPSQTVWGLNYPQMHEDRQSDQRPASKCIPTKA